jgi:hypothetical protein
MSKEKAILFACLILFVHCQSANCVQILEQKIISEKATDCDMHQAKLTFNGHDNILITMKQLLYADNNLIRIGTLTVYDKNDTPIMIKGTEDYCCNFLGGFTRDNQFYAVFGDVNTVNVYCVQKKPDIVNRIKPIEVSGYPSYDEVITIPENNNSYYLLGEYCILPLNPVEYVRTQVFAGGHGVYYVKPLLAEIQDNKMVRCIKLDYGGPRDESYVVQEAVAGKDSIHFFGFRNIDVPFIGNRAPDRLIRSGDDGYGLKRYNFDTGNYYIDRDITQSIILHYSDYNLKKGKNTRNCKIYENTPGYNEKTDTYCDYGVLSADTKEDDVFAVFSWVKWQRHRAGSTMVKYQGLQHKEGFSLNDVNSSIYYWQCSDKSYGKAEKIAEGFCPLVRVDQFGLVHVFWLDRSGNVVQKAKKDDKWSSEEIILSGFNTKPIIYTKYCSSAQDDNRPEAILYTKFFSAEFDKGNNLHAVYPTAEGIVYTKMKLE